MKIFTTSKEAIGVVTTNAVLSGIQIATGHPIEAVVLAAGTIVIEGLAIRASQKNKSKITNQSNPPTPTV